MLDCVPFTLFISNLYQGFVDILRFFARNRVIITQLKTKKKKMKKNILGFFVFCIVILCVFITVRNANFAIILILP